MTLNVSFMCSAIFSKFVLGLRSPRLEGISIYYFALNCIKGAFVDTYVSDVCF